ncbi:MAG: S8 family serine peptidase [Candidatus Aminicenantes bacterium]|nr:MAG: S8 family serine peptidase [Candidatus Aminicenantes bacterium]
MMKTKLFKTISLILFLSIVISSGISQRDEKISPRMRRSFDKKALGEKFVAWIYFRDKGPGKLHRMEITRLDLNWKSLNRRLRHGFEDLVDEFDIPVYQPYVDFINQYVHRIRHTSRWLNAVSVEATRQSLEIISSYRFVKKVDEVLGYTFRDPVIEQRTGAVPQAPLAESLVFDYGMSLSQVNQLNVPPLHNLGYSGQGVLICMLDSGFNNLKHKALDHLDIVATWDFVNGDSHVFDEEGQMGNGDHGTNTLGTIAGYEPGELIGPAFGASFLLGKTENSEWERHIEEDHWIAGAEWADTFGADIISSSLGYRNQFSHGEIDYSWQDMDGESTVVAQGANIAASRGILIVNSAGNEGLSLSGWNTLVSPSDSAHVLAAGAVNSQGRRTNFSSVGPTADGRIKPDVMAMGDSVYSASPNDPGEYELVDGTSFACPLVAGVAALILEVNPSWTNQDVMNAMKSAASQSASPDNSNGWGIVDAQKAAFFPMRGFHAPLLFTVARVENNYGFFIQYIDQLAWTPNPRNGDQVVSYRLYAKQWDSPDQSFTLLVEVNAQTFSFLRRGLLEEENFLYKITSVNASGEESDPNYTLR